jgi:hypothetical protein
MIQLLAGLITCLLLAIYCQENYNEKVSIKRVRESRIMIQNEVRNLEKGSSDRGYYNQHYIGKLYAKT